MKLNMKYKTIFWPLMSKAGRDTWDALQIKEDWEPRGMYTIRHIKSNWELWMGNGSCHFQPYELKHGEIFTFFDRLACYKQAKKALSGNLPWSK